MSRIQYSKRKPDSRWFNTALLDQHNIHEPEFMGTPIHDPTLDIQGLAEVTLEGSDEVCEAPGWALKTSLVDAEMQL